MIVIGTFLQFYMRAGVFTDGGKGRKPKPAGGSRDGAEPIGTSRSAATPSPARTNSSRHQDTTRHKNAEPGRILNYSATRAPRRRPRSRLPTLKKGDRTMSTARTGDRRPGSASRLGWRPWPPWARRRPGTKKPKPIRPRARL